MAIVLIDERGYCYAKITGLIFSKIISIILNVTQTMSLVSRAVIDSSISLDR